MRAPFARDSPVHALEEALEWGRRRVHAVLAREGLPREPQLLPPGGTRSQRNAHTYTRATCAQQRPEEKKNADARKHTQEGKKPPRS